MSIRTLNTISTADYERAVSGVVDSLNTKKAITRARNFVNHVYHDNPYDVPNTRMIAADRTGRLVGINYMLNKTFRVYVQPAGSSDAASADLDPATGIFPHDKRMLQDLASRIDQSDLHVHYSDVDPSRAPALARALGRSCIDYYSPVTRDAATQFREFTLGPVGRIGDQLLVPLPYAIAQAEK